MPPKKARLKQTVQHYTKDDNVYLRVSSGSEESWPVAPNIQQFIYDQYVNRGRTDRQTQAGVLDLTKYELSRLSPALVIEIVNYINARKLDSGDPHWRRVGHRPREPQPVQASQTQTRGTYAQSQSHGTGGQPGSQPQGHGGAQPPTQGYGAAQYPIQGHGGAQPPTQGYGAAQYPIQGHGGAQPPIQGHGGAQPPTQGFGGAPNPSTFGPPSGADASRQGRAIATSSLPYQSILSNQLSSSRESLSSQIGDVDLEKSPPPNDYYLKAEFRAGGNDVLTKSEQIFIYERVYKDKKRLADVADDFTTLPNRASRIYEEGDIYKIADYMEQQRVKKTNGPFVKDHWSQVTQEKWTPYPRVRSTGKISALTHFPERREGIKEIVLEIHIHQDSKKLRVAEQQAIYSACHHTGFSPYECVYAFDNWEKNHRMRTKGADKPITYGEEQIDRIVRYMQDQIDARVADEREHWRAVQSMDRWTVAELKRCLERSQNQGQQHPTKSNSSAVNTQAMPRPQDRQLEQGGHGYQESSAGAVPGSRRTRRTGNTEAEPQSQGTQYVYGKHGFPIGLTAASPDSSGATDTYRPALPNTDDPYRRGPNEPTASGLPSGRNYGGDGRSSEQQTRVQRERDQGGTQPTSTERMGIPDLLNPASDNQAVDRGKPKASVPQRADLEESRRSDSSKNKSSSRDPPRGQSTPARQEAVSGRQTGYDDFMEDDIIPRRPAPNISAERGTGVPPSTAGTVRDRRAPAQDRGGKKASEKGPSSSTRHSTSTSDRQGSDSRRKGTKKDRSDSPKDKTPDPKRRERD